jgi:Transposase.
MISDHLCVAASFRTARELQQDLRRVTGVIVSDQTVRNRLREDVLFECPV